MPSTRQAKKRMRQNEERRVYNKTVKTACKTQIKKVTGAVETGDREKAEKELSIATSRLYKASKRNIYHKNAVARKVSRLAKKVAAIPHQKPD